MRESLADQIIARCATGGGKNINSPVFIEDRRRIGNYVTDQLKSARRFFLDDEVTQAAVTLGVQHPDILLQMLRRARTPFPKVWIEWPVSSQLEAAGRNRDMDAADKAGVLIEALDLERPIYRMTEIGLTTDGTNLVSMLPFSVVYNLENPNVLPARRSDLDFLRDASGVDEALMKRLLLGNAYIGRSADGRVTELDAAELEKRREQCDRLTEHATYSLSPVAGEYLRKVVLNTYGGPEIDRSKMSMIIAEQRRGLNFQVQEFAGVWRIAISMLALLNAHDFVTDEERWRAGKSRFVGGKIVPYLEHRLVKLKLPRKIVEQRAVRQFGEGIPKRRHEVMGHWAESRRRGDPNCDHVYVEETLTREACVFCEKKRWWVRDHERGTAAIGYVTKDRVVVA